MDPLNNVRVQLLVVYPLEPFSRTFFLFHLPYLMFLMSAVFIFQQLFLDIFLSLSVKIVHGSLKVEVFGSYVVVMSPSFLFAFMLFSIFGPLGHDFLISCFAFLSFFHSSIRRKHLCELIIIIEYRKGYKKEKKEKQVKKRG